MESFKRLDTLFYRKLSILLSLIKSKVIKENRLSVYKIGQGSTEPEDRLDAIDNVFKKHGLKIEFLKED